MFCLGAAAHRVDSWNRNTETQKIANKDALACFILAIVVLLNLGIVHIFNENTPFPLFISGMAALFLTFWRKDIWAEFVSGLLALASLLYNFIPPV
jgi:branched-subunit amino acid transport protein AzlD